MVVHLDSRAERLIEEQISTGRFHSPEDVVTRALETLASTESVHQNTPEQIQAVRDMMDFVSKHRIKLGDDLTIQDLVTEGRKY
jgi:Arc/MetJ-type ribon-helix-helix transcriptional regulator